MVPCRTRFSAIRRLASIAILAALALALAGCAAALRTPPPADSAAEALPAFGDSVFYDVPPRLVDMPTPHSEVRADRPIHSSVVVWALVDSDGRVREARLNPPGTWGGFEPALAAVRQARFQPARANGYPVATWYPVPVEISIP